MHIVVKQILKTYISILCSNVIYFRPTDIEDMLWDSYDTVGSDFWLV